MNVLLFILSFGWMFALIVSATLAFGWMAFKLLDATVQLYLEITRPDMRAAKEKATGD